MTDNNTETVAVTRAELEAVASGDLPPDEVGETAGVTRRALLAAGAGAAVGGVGMATAGAASAEPSGALGAPGEPLEAAYIQQLDGPIVAVGGEVSELVNVIVAEEEESVDPDDDTLVVRIDIGGTTSV